MSQNSAASLITCSFSGDLEVCRLLCKSIDRFVPASIDHTLYVPANDMPLFAGLASPRRRIASQESLLPRWFWKVPMPGPEWRERLHLPRRNVYLTPYGLPIRGWIAQQIMKFAATAASSNDIVVHVDSDNAFIRPLEMTHLVRDGQVRLYRNPQMADLSSQSLWYDEAARLLGLPFQGSPGVEFIDQLVVWRRSVLVRMIERINVISGKHWMIALARTPHFSEYILYGLFAESVIGFESAGLAPEEFSLCLSRWSGKFSNRTDESTFINAIRPEHVACLIQSTIALSTTERRRIFERAAAFAAAQDSATTR